MEPMGVASMIFGGVCLVNVIKLALNMLRFNLQHNGQSFK